MIRYARQRKTDAPTSSQWKEFVVSKISVFGETNSTHRRSTPLPGGTEDVTSLKRATVETLSFWCPRLRFLQNGISESKGWKNNLLKTAKHDFLLRATHDVEPDFSVRSDLP